MISAITVTYGRARWVEQTLAAFQRQDCTCPWELLIVNTFPRQTLKGDFPNVRIVNLPHRPETLGYARNIAVAAAKGDRIVIADDDDFYLPHFIRTFNDNWLPGLEWIWLDKRLCASGDEIKEISYGCHGGCFGFTKHAWETVGGYPDKTVGEDRLLVQKITKLNGRKVALGDTIPPFICRWGQGTYHVSGTGDDRPNTPSAHVRIAAELTQRVATGQEKTGEILLHPASAIDWQRKAKDFMDAQLKKNSMNDVCVVELGRYGDIINILPILLHIHNEYGTPTLMVSTDFADLLDGVSYVKPFPVNLTNDKLEEALKLARKTFKRVICAQIWGGARYPQERLTPAFNMESWRMCGFLNKFDDLTWKPVFDRRCPEREEPIAAKIASTKPLLLVNTNSVSSPFPYGQPLLQILQRDLGKEFEIVNLAGLKLDRIYDLLGVMEQASCLVSVDTAHLHLAAATQCPVIALTNDAPWLGTRLRVGCGHAMTYSQAARDIQQTVSLIGGWARACEKPAHCAQRIEVRASPPVRTIFHCYERHSEKNQRELNRKGLAQRSWLPLYRDQGVKACVLDEKDYPRTALSIGDVRTLPYLKDVLALGLEVAAPEDIIFFTNDDNYLHRELPDLLRYHVSIYECGCAQRSEFKAAPMPPDTAPASAFAARGQPHMGRDLFAFTKRWLESHWNQIPDFILGCSDWDLCLACLIRNYFQIKSTRKNLETVIPPAEMPLGYVSHSFHAPSWNRPGYCNSAPGQLHNRRLFRDWARGNAPQLVFDKNLCI